MKYKDTLLAIAAVIGLVALFVAILIGCGGADFNAAIIPSGDAASQDGWAYDPGPRPAPEPFTTPHDAGSMSDAADAQSGIGDSSNTDVDLDAAASDMGPLSDGGPLDSPADSPMEPDAPAGPCDGGPLVNHTNGIGEGWSDCSPLGTMNQAQALKACIALTGRSTLCHTASPVSVAAIGNQGGNQVCFVWSYAGAWPSNVATWADPAGDWNACAPDFGAAWQ